MEENKPLEFLSKHWKKALYALLILACIGVWSERLFHKNRGNTKHDYLIVNQIFERYRMGNPIASESLEAAERVVQKHPELRSKYGTMLAHCCYAQNDPIKATSYATASLNHARDSLPAPFITYSNISLEISEGKLAEAYDHSRLLEETLASSEYEHLRAFNLLRLIFLSDKVEEDNEAYFKKLKELASFNEISPLFREGTLDLETYLHST